MKPSLLGMGMGMGDGTHICFEYNDFTYDGAITITITIAFFIRHAR